MNLFVKTHFTGFSEKLKNEQKHTCFFIDHSFFDSKKLAHLSSKIKKNHTHLFENSLLLCTCHRIEAYFPYTPKEDPIKSLLNHEARVITGKDESHSRLTGISCGLQSIILGEKFIYQQVEQAVNSLSESHPMKSFGALALQKSQKIREKHNFFAKDDYEGISFALINRLTEDSKHKILIVIGAGMLSQQVALYAGANHYSKVVMITRVAKKFRKKNRDNTYPFQVCSMHTLPADICDNPFHCFIATTNISKDYQTCLFDIVTRKNCKAIIDMSSIPAFKAFQVPDKVYITMYDKHYLHEVNISNSGLLPTKYLVENEISNTDNKQ